MALIADILNTVDATAASIVTDSVFTGIAGPLTAIVRLSAIIVVTLLGLNMAIQVVPVTFGSALMIMVRIALIYAFTFSWSNFTIVYNALTNFPAEAGASILSGLNVGSSGSLYDGLDNVFNQIIDIGTTVSQNGGYIAGPIAGLVMFIAAALMAAAALIVLSLAKVMIGVLALIGPIAIACSMLKQTQPIFEAWVKQAIGFAFVPLLATAVIGFILIIFQTTAGQIQANVSTLSDIVGFLLVSFVGTALILSVPSTASAFGATSLSIGAAAVGAYGAGRGAASSAITTPTGAALSAGAGGIANRTKDSTSSTGKTVHAIAAASQRAIDRKRRRY